MLVWQNVCEVNRERSCLTAASSVYDSTKHNGPITILLSCYSRGYSIKLFNTKSHHLFQKIRAPANSTCTRSEYRIQNGTGFRVLIFRYSLYFILVLVPAFTFSYYLLGFFFYDFEGNLWMDAIFWNFFVNFVIFGIGQTSVCMSVSFIFCPIGWTFFTLCAVVRKGMRNAWDTCVFQVII